MKKIFTLLFVAVMATATYAETLTVCNGEEQNSYAPMYGLYYDTEGTTSQMIYPADMLTEMQGGQITKLSFFARDAFAFGEGQLQLSFMIVDNDSFAESATITGATAVATGAPVDGETELVFTLDEPYTYDGGNLLVETMVTVPAGWKTTYFMGINTENASSLYQYHYSWSETLNTYTQQFLPKAEFDYTKEASAIEGVNANKAVSGVRYYNLAGQQMSQPSGATIVVTTYADGTTSSSKIVK